MTLADSKPMQATHLPPPPPPPVGRLLSPSWLVRFFGIRVALERSDRMRWTTALTLVTIVTAIICAALGRIPVDLPMPTHVVGWVCPTCGLTRGTVAITRGHYALAYRYNPLSFLVPLAAVLVMARLAAGAAWGRWVNVRYRPTRLAWALGGSALEALWGYQQSHAMFIMHSHVV
jgi:hypothetical protein